MLNTYGKKDKCCLCLYSLPLILHACSATIFPFYLWEQSGKRQRREGIYFWLIIDSTAWCFPLEGTIMILRPNDICLRPIRTVNSENVSTGIMSDWSNSAPLRWSWDHVWKAIQVELHHSYYFVNETPRLLFHFSAAPEWNTYSTTCGSFFSGLEVESTEQYLFLNILILVFIGAHLWHGKTYSMRQSLPGFCFLGVQLSRTAFNVPS